MATMELTIAGGFVVLIDEEDLPLVAGRTWHASRRDDGCSYAVSKGVLMHRLLMSAQRGQIVDHANRNGLDNRRENIRFCSHAQNMQNRRKPVTAEVTKFKGVSIVGAGRRTRPYQAEIEAFGERVYLGAFLTADRAARAYDRAARIFHGKFAQTNASLGIL